MVETLNVMNSGEFNSLMSHMFKSLSFYPTVPYLLETKTLNFVLWNPLEEHPSASAPQPIIGAISLKKATTPALETLKISNLEMEQLLRDLEEPKKENFILDKPLWREFTELSASTFIALSPLEMKILVLTLRNTTEQIPFAVALIPQLELKKATQNDKGEIPLNNSSLPSSDSMKFII